MGYCVPSQSLLSAQLQRQNRAQEQRYKDRDSVGKYMRKRGYEWDEKEETYLLPGGAKHNNKSESGNSLEYEHEVSRNNKGTGKSEAENRGLSEEEVAKIIQYLPTLQKLHKEKETLGIILEENREFAAKTLTSYLISCEETLKFLSLPIHYAGYWMITLRNSKLAKRR